MYQIFFFHKDTPPTATNAICLNPRAPQLSQSYCLVYNPSLTREELNALPTVIPRDLHRFLGRAVERIYQKNDELGVMLRNCITERRFIVIPEEEDAELPVQEPPPPAPAQEQPKTQRTVEANLKNADTDMIEQNNDFTLALQHLARIQSLVSDKSEILQDTQRIRTLQETYGQKLENLECLNNQATILQTLITDQEQRLEESRRELSQALEAVTTVTAELDGLKTEMVALESKHQEVEQELQSLQEHREELRKLATLLKQLNLE